MKKLITKIAVVAMILSLMTTTAFAGTLQGSVSDNNPVKYQVQLEKNSQKATFAEEKILAVASDTNARIALEIENAILKADLVANDRELEVLIANLLKKTEQISAVAVKKIERLGGEAVCDWVTVEIGGQTILVDPIRIVRLR